MPAPGFLGGAYLWVIAFHLIFVIFLMAALFMLPRFFIYHHEEAPGTPADAAWVKREWRLIRIILNPALIMVWILGLTLAANGGYWMAGWFHSKLLLVLALSGYHGWAVGYARKLRRGERPYKDRTLRLLNEVPGVAAILIVILAVVKPY